MNPKIGLIVSLALFILVFWAFDQSYLLLEETPVSQSVPVLAESILGEYVLAFEVLSILLLAAMMGAIYLAKIKVEVT